MVKYGRVLNSEDVVWLMVVVIPRRATWEKDVELDVS